MSKGNSNALIVAAAILGGAALWKYGPATVGAVKAAPVTLPTPGTPGTPGGLVGVPVGAGGGAVVTAPPAGTLPTAGQTDPAAAAREAARLAELERQREIEWRRADTIRTLKADLSDVQNRLKIITAELTRIDGLPIPEELTASFKAQHVADCQKVMGWWADGWCARDKNNLTEGYDVRLAEEWTRRKDSMKQPYLVEASALNEKQGRLLANLRELGENPTGATVGSPAAGVSSGAFPWPGPGLGGVMPVKGPGYIPPPRFYDPAPVDR